MTKADLRARLDLIGVRPSKMLGQNFLFDPNLAKAIVADLEPAEGDHLVEVGPGMGALTKHIVESPARRITLIERDHRLAAEMGERYATEIASGRLEVRQGDGAKTDLLTLFGDGPVKMVGNLPYSASTAIISHFATAFSPASRLVLMVQREVADRLAARAGLQPVLASAGHVHRSRARAERSRVVLELTLALTNVFGHLLPSFVYLFYYPAAFGSGPDLSSLIRKLPTSRWKYQRA